MFSSFKLFQTTQNQLDHKQLFSLINSLHDSFIAVDDAGRVTVCNSAALSLLNDNHLEGKALGQVLHLYDSQGRQIDILKSMPDPQKTWISSDCWLQGPAGSKTRLRVAVSPVRPAHQDIRISGHVLYLSLESASGS